MGSPTGEAGEVRVRSSQAFRPAFRQSPPRAPAPPPRLGPEAYLSQILPGFRKAPLRLRTALLPARDPAPSRGVASGAWPRHGDHGAQRARGAGLGPRTPTRRDPGPIGGDGAAGGRGKAGAVLGGARVLRPGPAA